MGEAETARGAAGVGTRGDMRVVAGTGALRAERRKGGAVTIKSLLQAGWVGGRYPVLLIR